MIFFSCHFYIFIGEELDYSNPQIDVIPIKRYSNPSIVLPTKETLLNNNTNNNDINDTNNDTTNLNNNISSTKSPSIAPTISIFDPSIQNEFSTFRKTAVGLTIFLSIFFFILLLITYGNGWNPGQYYSDIEIGILNSDYSSNINLIGIGNSLNTVNSVFSSPYNFHINVISDNSENAYENTKQKLSSGDFWGVVIINKNSSDYLEKHLYNTSTAASAMYASNPTITFISDSGRGGSYMNGLIKLWSTKYIATYNTIITSEILNLKNQNAGNFKNINPVILSTPVVSQSIDLHPLPFSGIDGAVSGMYIFMFVYLVIFSMRFSCIYGYVC